MIATKNLQRTSSTDLEVAIDRNTRVFRNETYWAGRWWSALKKVLDSSTRTQADIANELGVTPQRVNQILRNEPDLRFSTIVRIALAMDHIPHLVLEPIERYADRYYHATSMLVDENGRIAKVAVREYHHTDTKDLWTEWSEHPDPSKQKVEVHVVVGRLGRTGVQTHSPSIAPKNSGEKLR